MRVLPADILYAEGSGAVLDPPGGIRRRNRREPEGLRAIHSGRGQRTQAGHVRDLPTEPPAPYIRPRAICADERVAARLHVEQALMVVATVRGLVRVRIRHERGNVAATLRDLLDAIFEGEDVVSRLDPRFRSEVDLHLPWSSLGVGRDDVHPDRLHPSQDFV